MTTTAEMERCDNCRRLIRPDQVRVKHIGASWGEPAHTELACVHCCPTAEELEAARDADDDRRIHEALEDGRAW